MYNFFSDSNARGQYRLLNDLEIHTGERKKLEIEEELTMNELDVSKFNKSMQKKRAEVENDPDVETEEYTYFTTEKERIDILRNFSLLCNDLKHLYVSVTRPKQRLLIYDQNSEGRKAIRNYWETRGVVDIVTKGNEKDHPVLKDGFEAMENESSSNDEWRYMGFRLFRKKFYMSAASCFQKSNDEELRNRCFAYMHADKATALNSEAEVLFHISKNNKALPRSERTAKKTEAKKLKTEAAKEYIKAGEMLETIKCYKPAAQCYYTAKSFRKAAALFK